jgi:hypothetical protein
MSDLDRNSGRFTFWEIACCVWPSLFMGIIMPFMSAPEIGAISLAATLTLGVVLWCGNHYVSARRDRINRVTTSYFKIMETSPVPNGLCALSRSGAVELRSQSELNTVFKRVIAKEFPHPNCFQEQLPSNRVPAFLKFCRSEGHSLMNADEVTFVIDLFTRELKPDC